MEQDLQKIRGFRLGHQDESCDTIEAKFISLQPICPRCKNVMWTSELLKDCNFSRPWKKNMHQGHDHQDLVGNAEPRNWNTQHRKE